MANRLELKIIAKKRLRTVQVLMRAEDWEASVYMMALVLELALKAAACKSLRLENYPEGKKKDDDCFMTHKFDRLQRISGCSDLFNLATNKDAFDNWSQFTGAYLWSGKDWTSMRYHPKMLEQYNKEKAEELYNALYEDENSILRVMTGARRW
jgi:HEPN domain-containing protein